MSEQTEERRWNVFAAVLEDVLRAHDPKIGIGHLDDRPDPLTGLFIHREKVRRLQHSLYAPKRFPVLTPEELERVARTFHFTADELRQLQAAVLATAIESTLMNRIPNHFALAAAQDMLPLLTMALRESDSHSSFAAVKNWRLQEKAAEEGEDTRITYAIQLLEQGTLAKYLFDMTESQIERELAIRQATYYFVHALQFLEEVEESKRGEIWQFWHQVAQERLAYLQSI